MTTEKLKKQVVALQSYVQEHQDILLEIAAILKDFSKKSFWQKAIQVSKLVILLLSKIDEFQQKPIPPIDTAADIKL